MFYEKYISFQQSTKLIYIYHKYSNGYGNSVNFKTIHVQCISLFNENVFIDIMCLKGVDFQIFYQ